MDIITYALSKKIAEHAVSGVQSMSVEGQNLIINTKDSGVLTMTFPTPKDGISVTDIDVNANNQIVFTMSDGSEFISGKIPTVKGESGFSPTITENVDNTDKIYKLDITTADSTFTTPNLKGADGQGGTGGGEANIIDSISVNGVNITPDENKNVDIKVPSIEGLTKDADLATVAKSGNYEDLNNKPAIPTVTDEYNAESSEAASGKAINQAMSTLKGLPKPYFVFVDDDGKENFKTLYTDILQPRGIVGGLSIVFSSYTIDANKYLTQNEINEYSNLGWDILCHSTDLNSLTIDTADAVLNYCDNRIAYYGFKKSNIFVYPNGNEGDNKIAIEEKVAKHFKYAFNINYSHNCPVNIPLQNRMDIGRIIIPRASEITAEIKAYYKNLVDETINGNKLMIISTHSDKSDYTYLTELLDYILNQGYSFTSPVKALSEIDEYRFQNKLIPGDNISITPDNIISASFTESDPTVPNHVKSITAKNISDWNNKSDFSGSYNDLIDTPAIPSIEGLAKTEDIPTKVSELENDSNYLSSIPEEYVTETELEAKGYLTEHQDISGKADKTEVTAVFNSISDAWNSATAYTVGQCCIYNNALWKCILQHNGQTPEEGTYWTKTQIDDEILSIKNDVSTINSNFTNLIDVFFSSAQDIRYSFDYNTLTTNGLYYLNGSNPLNCTNAPEQCTNCYVIVFGESGRKHQIILAGNNTYAWYRNMVIDTTTWRGWKQIGSPIMYPE